MTTPEAPAIEVEVLEIDGTAPPVRPTAAPPTAKPTPKGPAKWLPWLLRLRKLDRRWWPLWVMLGSVAAILVLTVGLVIGVLLAFLLICRKIIRAVIR